MSSIFVRYFWIFVIGSFFGFLLETIWCVIRWKKLESRKGLIYGYFIPIYGIATIFISMIVEIFKIKNYGLFFVITFLICAIDEYIASVIQEKFFGTKSWDYSAMKGNLHGRINLLFLLAWSVVGILWCKYYPSILGFIFRVMNEINLLNELTLVFFIFMIYDCYISAVASYRQKLRRRGIKPLNKYEEWLDRKYNDERILKVYANAKRVE